MSLLLEQASERLLTQLTPPTCVLMALLGPSLPTNYLKPCMPLITLLFCPAMLPVISHE